MGDTATTETATHDVTRLRDLRPVLIDQDGNTRDLGIPLCGYDLTTMQYRAKQIDLMNPFITFHNQRITKNRFYVRARF